MSREDELGKGNFAPPTLRSDRGRAKAMAQGDIPPHKLALIKLDEVVATPRNPRRNFGTADDLTSFGEALRDKQLVPCVVVTRQAYLAIWPADADQLGDVAQYVLVNGERRLRSALYVGMEELDFIIRDDLAASRETFINHLLQENLAREDLDLVERARGVEALVTVCAEQTGERGAQSRAAERLQRSRSWVGNQLDLLLLPEELQQRLSEGTVSERDGRVMARFVKGHPEASVEMLLAHLAETRQAEKAKKESKGPASAAPEPENAAGPTGTPQPRIPAPSPSAEQRTAEKPDDSAEHWTGPPLPADCEAEQPEDRTAAPKQPIAVDPVARLDYFRQKALQFGRDMYGLEEIYRDAAKADPEAAAEHLEVIKERVDRVVRHLAATPAK